MIVGFEEYRHRYDFDVRGIVHVGAHLGQEYASYIETFGKVDTHWFEPLPHIYSQLERGIGSEPGVFLYNFALGESESSVEMYVDSVNGGQSSSILQPKEHTSIYSHIVFDGREIVQVRRLDDFDLSGCNMLVIDTQGFELSVLKGGNDTLKKIDYIFLEFNSVEMYEGCPTLEDIDSFLSGFGFSRKETWHTDGKWGDAFYMRDFPVKREIVIIDCFVSNKEVEAKLVAQISRFKSRGLDVMVVSNTPLERDIIESVDYYLYDKRNQLFQNDYDDVAGVRFTETIHSDGMSFAVHKIRPGLQRHGLSVLVNMHNSVSLAKSLGYDRFWRAEVDDLFSPQSMDFIVGSGRLLDSSGKKALLFRNLPSESNVEIRANISFHFMYWEIDYFLSVVPRIGCEDDYVLLLDSVYGSRRFVIVEEFVYDSVVRSGDDDVLFFDGGKMGDFFPGTSWNTCMSLSNIGVSGSSTSVYNMPGDDRKFVFSKSYVDDPVYRRISLVYPWGKEDLSHEMPSLGCWCWNIVSPGLVSIDVSDGDGNFLYSESIDGLPSYVEFL